MPEYKISCPHCSLHIVVTEEHAGTAIACPTCQKEMRVPAPAPAQAPASHAGGARVAAAPSAHSKPGPPVPPPSRRRDTSSEEKQQKKKAILVTVGVLVVLGIALAVLWPTIQGWQSGLDKARAESGAGMVGEQMGHIAELNSVLDATDPGRYSGPPMADESPARDRRNPLEAKLSKLTPATAAWSAEAPTGSLSEGRANGTLSGAAFLVESASLLTGGGVPILTLRQGQANAPQGEVLIYLRSKRGESLEGKTFRVTASDAKPDARIIKRGPAGSGQSGTFAKGFALRLEFGKASEGLLPGKLYLSLPDREKSVVTGVFFATLGSVQAPNALGSGAGRDED